jgi:hypothetical protein
MVQLAMKDNKFYLSMALLTVPLLVDFMSQPMCDIVDMAKQQNNALEAVLHDHEHHGPARHIADLACLFIVT